MDQRYNSPVAELIANQWYPIYRCDKLRPGRPVGVRRLGEDLVLWRDRDGLARAAHRGCPHRGADLALGRVKEGELECPYHGFRYAGDGTCTAIPCEGRDARIPPKLRLQSRPVVEEHGLLWLFAGNAATPTRPWIPGLPEHTRDVACRDMTWNVPLSRVIEGMVDIHHLPFAHRRYVSSALTRLDPYDAHFDASGILRSEGVMRRDTPGSAGWRFIMDVAPPSVLSIGLGERDSPSMVGLVACCPIDDEHTWITLRYALRSRWGSGVRRLLSEIALWAELRFIQVDDHRLLQTSRPHDHEGPARQFVHADKAAGLWHRWRRRAMGRVSLPLVTAPDAAPPLLSAPA